MTRFSYHNCPNGSLRLHIHLLFVVYALMYVLLFCYPIYEGDLLRRIRCGMLKRDGNSKRIIIGLLHSCLLIAWFPRVTKTFVHSFLLTSISNCYVLITESNSRITEFQNLESWCFIGFQILGLISKIINFFIHTKPDDFLQ